MNNKKSWLDKLNTFIFGQPIPVLSHNDLDAVHQLNDRLEAVLTPLRAQPSAQIASSPAEQAQTLDDLAEQVRKLAKTQFKANALQETQLAQQQASIATSQQALEQQELLLNQLRQQQQYTIAQAQLELLTTLLPVLDSLDAAFESGRKQVLKLAMPSGTRQAMIAWLDGIRLARLRLLDVLQAHHVTPIPTEGLPFDPNRHIAVAVDASGRARDGIIVAEDRRGYAIPDKVLRYAEVVVAQAK